MIVAVVVVAVVLIVVVVAIACCLTFRLVARLDSWFVLY